jgi:hypothetical protein
MAAYCLGVAMGMDSEPSEKRIAGRSVSAGGGSVREGRTINRLKGANQLPARMRWCRGVRPCEWNRSDAGNLCEFVRWRFGTPRVWQIPLAADEFGGVCHAWPGFAGQACCFGTDIRGRSVNVFGDRRRIDDSRRSTRTTLVLEGVVVLIRQRVAIERMLVPQRGAEHGTRKFSRRRM